MLLLQNRAILIINRVTYKLKLRTFLNFYLKNLKLNDINFNLCVQRNFSDVQSNLKLTSTNVSYSNADFNESSYYFEYGLRKVYPYYYTYKSYCKKRWISKTVSDVFYNEFVSSKEDLYKRIYSGKILINNKIVDPNYAVKHGDMLSSTTHRHELAVLATPIHILYDDGDTVIINKPPSIPVHPCGLYRHNSILFILAKEYNLKGLRIAHRLDKLTSGLLIFCRSFEKSREMHMQFQERKIKKTYVCRVEGEFPDGIVKCDKSIWQIRHKVGVSIISPKGRKCLTEFQKISFNGKSSVILCRPMTGRTHQIRVHLQYLGYPIINDPLYNSEVFGPKKGKYGDIGKSICALLNDLELLHTSDKYLISSTTSDPTENMNINNVSTLTYQKNNIYSKENKLLKTVSNIYTKNIPQNYIKDSTKVTFDPECRFCNTSYKDPKERELIMFLHALKYENDSWGFHTDMPNWATENWTE